VAHGSERPRCGEAASPKILANGPVDCSRFNPLLLSRIDQRARGTRGRSVFLITRRVGCLASDVQFRIMRHRLSERVCAVTTAYQESRGSIGPRRSGIRGSAGSRRAGQDRAGPSAARAVLTPKRSRIMRCRSDEHGQHPPPLVDHHDVGNGRGRRRRSARADASRLQGRTKGGTLAAAVSASRRRHALTTH
jgi:hypothetical protein